MDSDKVYRERVTNHCDRAACILGLIALVFCCSGILGGHCAERPRSAKAGYVELGVTLLAKDGTITADEPLLARLEVRNVSRDDVEVRFSNQTGSAVYWQVRDSEGILLAATPRPRPREGGLGGRRFIKAGKTDSNIWIISALHRFQKPGAYDIQVQLLDLADEDLSVMVQDTISVRVLPFDASRLEARCEEIFQPMRKGGCSKTGIPLGVRATVLYSVRHDVVLPYLDWMARKWADQYACRAMRRIGTPEARALINVLAARDDKAGEAARKALAIPLKKKNILWDMGQ